MQGVQELSLLLFLLFCSTGTAQDSCAALKKQRVDVCLIYYIQVVLYVDHMYEHLNHAIYGNICLVCQNYARCSSLSDENIQKAGCNRFLCLNNGNTRLRIILRLIQHDYFKLIECCYGIFKIIQSFCP